MFLRLLRMDLPFHLVVVGTVSCSLATMLFIARNIETPHGMEALPAELPPEVVTAAQSGAAKIWHEGESGGEQPISLTAKERRAVQGTVETAILERERVAESSRMLERFRNDLMRHEVLTLACGGLAYLGLTLLILSQALRTETGKRFITHLIAGTVQREAELRRKESELAKKECMLNQREERLSAERETLDGQVKAAVNARLTTELLPREQAVAKREAELKKREAAFEAAKAEAEVLLQQADSVREERRVVEQLLADADTQSGGLAAREAELARRELIVQQQLDEARSLNQAMLQQA